MSIEQAHIRKWLKALGALCAGSTSVEDVEAKLNAYTTMLSRRFPAGAFTGTSLEEVAAKCKFFPAYGELCDHLGAWWRDHRPNRFQALPPPSTEERAPPTDAERAMQAKTMQAFMEEIGQRASAQQQREAIKPAYLTGAALEAVRRQYGKRA